MILRLITATIFTLFVSLFVFGKEDSSIDSLRSQIEGLGCLDRDRSDSLISLFESEVHSMNIKEQFGYVSVYKARNASCEGDYKSAVKYAMLGISFFQEMDDLKGEVSAINHLTSAYRKLHKIDSALLFTRKVGRYGRQMNDSTMMAMSANAMASAFIENHSHDSALFYALASLKLAEAMNDPPPFSPAILHNLAIAYTMEGDLENAKRMYLKSEKEYEESNYRQGMPISIYNNLGRCLVDLGQYDSAIFIYEKGLRKNAILENGFMEAYINRGLGRAYWLKGQPAEAIKHSLISKEVSERFSLQGNLVVVLSNLTNYFAEDRKYEQAIEYGIEGLRIAESTGNNGIKKLILENLSKAYEQAGDVRKAFEMLTVLRALDREMEEGAKSREFLRLQAEYEAEKKESQIRELSQESRIQGLRLRQQRVGLIGLAGIVVLLSFGGVLVVQQRKLREKQKLTNLELEETKKRLEVERQYRTSELKALRSQMNPHFVFNALNSIQEYIILNEKKLAGKYLGKFADLMRLYLEHSNKATVTVGEELEALSLYLELEKLRFEDSLFYVVAVEENVEETIEIPPLLLQPHVENALKHGLLHKKTDRNLRIQLSQVDEVLTCEIIDNGIGRKRSAEVNAMRNPNHQSFATEATQSRIALLNQDRQRPIEESIQDAFEDLDYCGTHVTIKIPI